MLGNGACFYFARPSNNKGDPDSTFIKIALPSPETFTSLWIQVRSQKSMGIFIIFKIALPAIIAGNENNGIIIDPHFFQQVHNLANLPVHHFHHGSIHLGIMGPLLIRGIPFPVFVLFPCRFIVRHCPKTMRGRPWKISKERAILVLLDKVETGLKD